MHAVRTPLKVHAAALLALLGAACRNPSNNDGDGDGRACQQSYEFGNFGCAEVRGRVLGSGGAPLSGVSVGPVYPAGTSAYNSPFVTTDLEGRFTFRVQRFGPLTAPATPDTFSVFVRAALIPPPVGSAPPTAVRDSVRVTLTLSPLGQVPTPATVELRLAYP